LSKARQRRKRMHPKSLSKASQIKTKKMNTISFPYC
jgi:hypothetical protein